MRWLSMIAAMITVAASLAASRSYSQTCQQLWFERNQYYKNHGYCFTTQRAIEFFRQWGLLHQRSRCRPTDPGRARAHRPNRAAGTRRGRLRG